MTTVPLGRGAWKRNYAGEPEVQLLNRWVESNPTNLKEGVALIARPGTNQLLGFNPGAYDGENPMRGQYVLNGLFNDALFVVCGENLYKVTEDPEDQNELTVTQIQGIIHGNGYPEVSWSKGPGYEQLWIADGVLLQYYGGTTSAKGTLTKTGTITSGGVTVQIGGIYYAWNDAVNSGSPAGTNSNPYRVTTVGDPMANLIAAIMFTGTPGTTYSSTIGGQNTDVTAEAANDLDPVGAITVIAREAGTIGNNISTTVPTGSSVSFGGAFLANGGIEALQGCAVPDGQTVISTTQVSGYVLVAVANSQKFYWVNPGEVTIDPLNFASKESSPDNIVAMRTVGDQVAIMGAKSTENWYATGNKDTPFAPIEGRVYARGVYPGSAVVVDEAAFVVGDDGRVYAIGYKAGEDAGFGIDRISNNGIEERIRRQIRREGGLKP